ncbi:MULTISPECIES: PhoH family protein [Caloramator]|uniref:PhoH-like protein n=1 Tax=Caloramator proteoclasticus DSM 10124 TaxID=1121262 RepID=A0A1M4WX83_9CLOT|nr:MULTISPECIES: PhoH family protein [Caloramator]SHE85808.1 phosphate starvation-inducible protein PhoH [Caloramator proteoclasticus DSM 10124]
MQKESKILIDNLEQLVNLFGKFDENIKIIEQCFNVFIINRDNEIKITGVGQVDLATKTILKLLEIAKRNEIINKQTVNYIISLVLEDSEEKIENILDDVIITTAKGKPVKCKTLGQKTYIDSIRKNDIVFGIGPAGTGKTYLAIAMAVKFLRDKKVNRIVLTRPAVEAGERLGFLPGDLQEKINPYLRPLYDALFDILGVENFNKYMESGIIEVAPLAYMRGRTLDDCFIILDEAQNTTPEQMKMFLTRFGYGSRIVVTGDLTQIDLGQGKVSGLKQVTKILKNIPGIDFIYFSDKDVVRHKLVSEIIKAYNKFEEENENR